MKRIGILLVVLSLIAVVATGCGQTGSIDFSMDLSPLLAGKVTAQASITSVTVTLTRTGYSTVTKTLTVSSNVATGRVDNLAPGIWTLGVLVYDGTTVLFTGERPVDVVAGLVQQVTILVDPGDTPATNGSISISVGLNPLPGYKPLYQLVSSPVMDTAAGRLYLLDTTTNKIGVYTADTMTREKDLTVTQAPSVMVLDWNKTALLLGYPTGKVFSLDIATGVATQLADLAMPIKHLLPFGTKYLLAGGTSSTYSYTENFKVWASDTNTIVDTASGDTASGTIEFNPVNSTAYYSDSSDLYRIRINAATGDITITSNYSSGGWAPVRVILNGTRLASGSGNMFTCSDLDASDLVSAGSLGSNFIDLVNDDTSGSVYFVSSQSSPYRLCAMKHSDLLVNNFTDLKGTPRYLFQTATGVIVITEDNGKFYARVWNKTDFGL